MEYSLIIVTFELFVLAPEPLPEADCWPEPVVDEFVPLFVPLFALLPIAVGPTPVMKR